MEGMRVSGQVSSLAPDELGAHALHYKPPILDLQYGRKRLPGIRKKEGVRPGMRPHRNGACFPAHAPERLHQVLPAPDPRFKVFPLQAVNSWE
jgi:hypothetical protein